MGNIRLRSLGKNCLQFLRGTDIKTYVIKSLLVISLMVVGFYISAFMLISALFLALFIVMENSVQSLHYLLTIFPIVHVYRFDAISKGNLYYWMLLLIVGMIGIKYIISLIKKEQKLDFKTIIPYIILLIYVVVVTLIRGGTLYNCASFCLFTGIIYLFCVYRKELNIKNIVLLFTFMLIVSGAIGLFKDKIPYLMDKIPQHKTIPLIQESQIRFCGLTVNPNEFGYLSVMAFAGCTLLHLTNNLSFKEYLITMPLFAFVYMTNSRSSMLAIAFLLAVYVLFQLIHFSKQKLIQISIIGICIIAVIVGCFGYTKDYLYRAGFKQVYNNYSLIYDIGHNNLNTQEYNKCLVDIQEDDGIFYGNVINIAEDDIFVSSIEVLDLGRKKLFDVYWKASTSSISNMLFGHGIYARQGNTLYVHNIYLLLFYQLGIVGSLIFLVWLIALCGLNFKNKKQLMYYLICVATPIAVVGIFEPILNLGKGFLFGIILVLLSKVKNPTINKDAKVGIENIKQTNIQ